MSEAEAAADACAYCQLPLPRAWGEAARRPADEPAYCCLGCRMAADITRERGEAGAAQWTLIKLGLSVFFTMNVMAFTMALWTTDVYGRDDPHRLASSLQGLLRSLSLLFSAPVLFLLGGALLENAWEGLRRGVISTDLLLATGVLAAFVYSAASIARGHGPIYFEVGSVILVMVTLGRWLEATGKIKATEALDQLAHLLPMHVCRIENGREERIPLAAIAVGQQLRVRPGERFPADGRLLGASALVDEQVLTGESRPVCKQRGDSLFGGTLNLDGDLVLEVTAAGAGGTLARLIDLVRRARTAKGRFERLADRVSAWFFPIVMIVAVATVAAHWRAHGMERGLLSGLAVVLIACPCALGLATPLAVWTALGRAAAEHVLFQSGEALERLAAVRAVRFDKTGTLTTGTPTVSKLLYEEDAEPETVRWRAALLAASSSHALAQAIVRLVNQPESFSLSHELRVFPGLGVGGSVSPDAGLTLLGSQRLMSEHGLELSISLERQAHQASLQGQSVSFLGWNHRVQALFVFDEELRHSARPALAECRRMGLDLAILTGDHPARGQVLAQQLEAPVQAGLLPEDKVAAIHRAQELFGPVAMVGDGINDAPALATSDVGIALGCGTDLSRDSAIVCLLGNDLERLPWSIDLARRTVRTVRWNLAWAFGYNTLGVVCAAAGWLNPALAALLMVASSVFVIANSLSAGRMTAISSGTAQPHTIPAFPGSSALLAEGSLP